MTRTHNAHAHAHTRALVVHTLHTDGTRTTRTLTHDATRDTVRTPPRALVMLAVWLAHRLAR
jgi:hypothetical protein